MPSKSKRQARFFAMIAHSPEAAKRTGVPMSVAKEFNQADAGTGILKGPRPKKGKKRRRIGTHKK